jgi:hypothetical protein
VARRDVVPAAKVAEDRHLLTRFVVLAEALKWTDRTLGDAPIPVEIGSLRLDEALDDGFGPSAPSSSVSSRTSCGKRSNSACGCC